MAIRNRYRKVVKYAVAAQKAAMKARNIYLQRQKLQQASRIAASLKVSRERFSESIKEHGLEKTLHDLALIKKLSYALQKHPDEIQEMLKRHSIEKVSIAIAEEFQEAREMGVV